MPIILPIRELKNTATISKFVEETNEPVFITKNGYGSMVIMNLEVYEKTFEIKGLVNQRENGLKSIKNENQQEGGKLYLNETKSNYKK